MPQMAPLMWILLFTSFSVFLMMNTLKTYFNSHLAPALPNSIFNNSYKNKNYVNNWKW